MAFITPAIPSVSSFTRRRTAISSVRVARVNPTSRRVRMGLGEDGLNEDLDFAKNCLEEGCEVDAVQDVLTRLERRRAVLALELSEIERVMGDLVRSNEGNDRNLVAQAMAAAVSIFSKANDDYPSVGSSTNAWTLDPLKKQPKL